MPLPAGRSRRAWATRGVFLDQTRASLRHIQQFRVRYSEIDQMGTYYNARALEWFEWGRTELCRALGKPYRQWEQDGVRVPLVTAHVEYQGRAQYDDELKMTTTAAMAGRARLRFDIQLENAQTGRARLPRIHHPRDYRPVGKTDPTAAMAAEVDGADW